MSEERGHECESRLSDLTEEADLLHELDEYHEAELPRLNEENQRLRQDLAAAKFGEREWRDRAQDLTKDLDKARAENQRQDKLLRQTATALHVALHEAPMQQFYERDELCGELWDGTHDALALRGCLVALQQVDEVLNPPAISTQEEE